MLFNILFEDLEEVMKRKQKREWVIGNKKISMVAYADDVALVANDKEKIKEMMKTFKKFQQRKGLEFNTEKSKIMEFRKEGEKRKRSKFFWEPRKEIEKVKEFKYLGYC